METIEEKYEIECSETWAPLYTPIIEAIEAYNESCTDEEKIEILQIKSKFGGLRFYVNHCPDNIKRMIRDAESKSYGMCELCGSTDDVGLISSHGWLTTACRKCYEKTLVRDSLAKFTKKFEF